MIKRLAVLLLLLATLTPLSAAKLKDITLRPGDTIYVRFDTSGKRLRLVEAGNQPNPQAQVTFSLERDTEKKSVVLRVENKLAKDLSYRAEMRSKRFNLKSQAPVTPVVAGKLGIEKFPELVDEFTAFDFAYAGYKPAPETPKQ